MSPKLYEPSAVALEGDSAWRLLGAELLIGMGERGALVWQIRFKRSPPLHALDVDPWGHRSVGNGRS